MVCCDNLVRVISHRHIVARFMGEYVTERYSAQITVICKRACLFLLTLGTVLGPPGLARAQSPLPLVTGEYPPYTGQGLPSGGMSTVLVKAIFKAAGLAEPKIDWQPWQRGCAAAEAGKYVATYPYARDTEWEKSFLYSDPLHTYRNAFFTRKKFSDAIEGRWNGLTLCVPLGWETSYLEPFLKTFNMTLVRPASMDLCLHMVERGRADLVPENAVAMVEEIKALFGRSDVLVESQYGQQDGLHLFFIISRQRPDAEEVLKKFNTGLAALRASGDYDRLVAQFMEQNSQ